MEVSGKYVVCTRALRTDGQSQNTTMLTRLALCDIQAAKIGKARAALANGIHDPELMEQIAHINEILRIVVAFEDKLFHDNMDID